MKKQIKHIGLFSIVMALMLVVMTACSGLPQDNKDDLDGDKPVVDQEPVDDDSEQPIDDSETNDNDGEVIIDVQNPENFVAEDVFETSLESNQQKDMLNITFSMHNQSEDNWLITYPSGQRFDYQILDDKGDSIYTWSANKSFIEAMQDIVVQSGETVEYTDLFDYTLMNGAPLETGTYTIEFNTSFYVNEEMITLDETIDFTYEGQVE